MLITQVVAKLFMSRECGGGPQRAGRRTVRRNSVPSRAMPIVLPELLHVLSSPAAEPGEPVLVRADGLGAAEERRGEHPRREPAEHKQGPSRRRPWMRHSFGSSRLGATSRERLRAALLAPIAGRSGPSRT
ncbi:hypothetical protein AB0J35_23605 [Nonomuraea angiospora]|uniref:hypothetical protein n=1 Tax=Nonomuraea angiospora TaxID=46172 RepID=UPI00341D17EB